MIDARQLFLELGSIAASFAIHRGWQPIHCRVILSYRNRSDRQRMHAPERHSCKRHLSCPQHCAHASPTPSFPSCSTLPPTRRCFLWCSCKKWLEF